MSTPEKNAIHRIDLPRIVLVGKSVLNQLASICHEFGFTKAFIVTGKTTYDIAGKKTIAILEENNIGTSHCFVKDATRETVEDVKAKLRETTSEVVLGIGGGRNIDVAKISAHELGRFFISVPTVASHDGIASCLASIKGTDRPYTLNAASPVAIVVDSEIIADSPYRFTASGSGDMICKAIEVRDWRLANRENGEYYGGYAASLSLMSSQHVMEQAKVIREKKQEGIRILIEALVSCGVAMSIAGSSRPTSGSSHLFSHALDQLAEKPALHGEQCGVGSIMMAKLHGLNWEAIRESLITVGAPTEAKQLGMKRTTIIHALVKAQSIRPDRYTILSKIPLDYSSAEALAESTGVI